MLQLRLLEFIRLRVNPNQVDSIKLKNTSFIAPDKVDLIKLIGSS